MKGKICWVDHSKNKVELCIKPSKTALKLLNKFLVDLEIYFGEFSRNAKKLPIKAYAPQNFSKDIWCYFDHEANFDIKITLGLKKIYLEISVESDLDKIITKLRKYFEVAKSK